MYEACAIAEDDVSVEPVAYHNGPRPVQGPLPHQRLCKRGGGRKKRGEKKRGKKGGKKVVRNKCPVAVSAASTENGMVKIRIVAVA